MLGKTVPFTVFVQNQKIYKTSKEAKSESRRQKKKAMSFKLSLVQERFEDLRNTGVASTTVAGVLEQYVDVIPMSFESDQLSEQLTMSSECDYDPVNLDDTDRSF